MFDEDDEPPLYSTKMLRGALIEVWKQALLTVLRDLDHLLELLDSGKSELWSSKLWSIWMFFPPAYPVAVRRFIHPFEMRSNSAFSSSHVCISIPSSS